MALTNFSFVTLHEVSPACHAPVSPSLCSPECRVWGEQGNWAPAGVLLDVCEPASPWTLFSFPKPATLISFFHLLQFTWSHIQVGAEQAPDSFEDSQSSAHSTSPRLALRCTRENAPGLTFSHKVLDQNLEKHLSVRYNLGPSTSGTSSEYPHFATLASLSPGLLKYWHAHRARISLRASAAPGGQDGSLLSQTGQFS